MPRQSSKQHAGTSCARNGAGRRTVFLDAQSLEEEFGAKLGLPVLISLAREPVAPEALDPQEREAYARLQGNPRLECWLRGRMALRNLLSRLEREQRSGHALLPSQGNLAEPQRAVCSGRSCEIARHVRVRGGFGAFKDAEARFGKILPERTGAGLDSHRAAD